MVSGVVYESGGGIYRVALEDGRTVDASLRGRLKLEARGGDRVVAGDRVRVDEAADGGFTIEEVLPRERELARRAGAGTRQAKVLAANVDRLVVVVAAREPEPREPHIDRLLALGESTGLECALVVNKLDLSDAGTRAEALRALYERVGYPVIATSGIRRTGLDDLEGLLCRGTSVLAGPSGAGKSTLLNALQPELDLRTGELSRKRGTGRHTTVGARLIPLRCGGLVADTPGFAEASLWNVPPEDVAGAFPELRPHHDSCRFRGCLHLHEPGCAVKRALEEGDIAPSRYESYAALVAEAEGAPGSPARRSRGGRRGRSPVNGDGSGG